MVLGLALSTAMKAATSAASSAAKNTSSSSKKVSNTDVIKSKGNLGNYNYLPESDFKSANQNFTDKWDANIRGISDYEGVDLGVAKEMLYTNLINNNGNYKGGGVVDDATWNAMRADAQAILSAANTATYGKGGYYQGSGGSSGGGGGGGASYGGGGGSSFSAGPRPTLRSGQSMADLLGIDYNLANIEGKMKGAVQEKYNNLDNEFRRSQDAYYDMTAGNADMMLGTMRRGDRDAVLSGTTAGTKAANEMSAMLGMSKDASLGATELVQARDDLVRQREADLAKVTTDAMKYYNDLGFNLGQLSASELNALVTAYASEVATEGGIYNTDVLAGVERDRISSTAQTAREQMASNERMSNLQNLTNKEISALTSLSNEEIARITGASNLEIEKMRQASYARSGSSYSGGSYSSGGSSAGSSREVEAGALFGLLQEATTPEEKAYYAGLIAEMYGVTPYDVMEGSGLDPDAIDAISGAAPKSSGGVNNTKSPLLPTVKDFYNDGTPKFGEVKTGDNLLDKFKKWFTEDKVLKDGKIIK